METIIVNREFEFVTEVCCICAVLFAIPKIISERSREDESDFFCPNGHGQHYTKSFQDEINELKFEASLKDETVKSTLEKIKLERKKSARLIEQIKNLKTKKPNSKL